VLDFRFDAEKQFCREMRKLNRAEAASTRSLLAAIRKARRELEVILTGGQNV
jgi:hypothetical protein